MSYSSSAPDKSILYSSELLPWEGIFCEQRYHLAGEYSYPGFSTHMICLHHGPPSFVEQIGNGRSHSGIMSQGGIQIVPVGTACIWRHPSATGFVNVLVTTDVLQRVAADLDQHRIELLPQFGIQDPHVEHICLALLAEVAAGGPSGRVYGEGLATALAAHLLSSYSSALRPLSKPTKGLPAPLLRRLLAMIDERLPEDLGLTELALMAGLSQFHRRSQRLELHGLEKLFHLFVVDLDLIGVVEDLFALALIHLGN